ncbi:MAG: hypothetical protein ABSC62_14140 [Terracidiphilus sp.]
MSEFAIAIDIGGSDAEYGIVSQDQVAAAETIQVADGSLQTMLLRLEREIPALATRRGVEIRMMAGIAVVFGGGLMQRQHAVLPKIREHVDRHAWTATGSVMIVSIALGSSTALLGALPLLRGQA